MREVVQDIQGITIEIPVFTVNGYKHDIVWRRKAYEGVKGWL